MEKKSPKSDPLRRLFTRERFINGRNTLCGRFWATYELKPLVQRLLESELQANSKRSPSLVSYYGIILAFLLRSESFL